jgi:leucyl-tRNA synthetase
MALANEGFEEEMHYDFAFTDHNLVIEVTSYKQEEKIERVRRIAQEDGKRLLILSNELLSDHINHPEVVADMIRTALKSREVFIMDTQKPHSEHLFVSHNLTHKYSPEAFSQLHVDVNIVENDVLDIEKARNKTMFERANFKLDAAGQCTCSWEIEKMSKSKFNVVNPDDLIEQYGADCFRMYEMFLGPIEDGKPWNTNGITGVSNFLRKFWGLYYDEKGWAVQNAEPTKDELRQLHLAIRRVTDDIERFSLNTCVSHFMILTNELRSLKCRKRAILEPALVLLAPFAPHIAEELWQQLGHSSSVCTAQWPKWEEAFLQTDNIVYPVQINGKHRGNIEVPTSMDKTEIEAFTLAQEFVQRNIAGGTIKKIVVVPGRIVNIVV